MKLYFISGRYRAATIRGVVENIRAAEAVALKYWTLGAVICPHPNTALLDGSLPDETWLAGDLEMLKRCDVIVMLPDWNKSAGAIQEHKLAVRLGLEVIYE